MLPEKSPTLENANGRVGIPLLTDFKPSLDDTLPLYTDSRVRTRVPSSWKRRFLVIGSLCLLLVLVRSIPLSCLPSTGTRSPAIIRNPAYLITAEHGAVATENKRCSDIGVDVLKEGGSAVDAAISAALCTGVVNMFSWVSSSLSCDKFTHCMKLRDWWRWLHDRSRTTSNRKWNFRGVYGRLSGNCAGVGE